MCTNVCMCVCAHMCIFVCVHVYKGLYMNVYTHIHTHYIHTWAYACNTHVHTHLSAHICTPVHTHTYTCHVCTHILVQTDVSQTELLICLCRIQLNSPLSGEQVCAFLSCQLRVRACYGWKNLLGWNALWFCRGSRAARGKAHFLSPKPLH